MASDDKGTILHRLGTIPDPEKRCADKDLRHLALRRPALLPATAYQFPSGSKPARGSREHTGTITVTGKREEQSGAGEISGATFIIAFPSRHKLFKFLDIALRFIRQGLSETQMRFIPSGTGMIGREQPRIAKPVIHLAQIGRACENIVTRVEGIIAKPMTLSQFGPGCWHQLHQSHRPG